MNKKSSLSTNPSFLKGLLTSDCVRRSLSLIWQDANKSCNYVNVPPPLGEVSLWPFTLTVIIKQKHAHYLWITVTFWLREGPFFDTAAHGASAVRPGLRHRGWRGHKLVVMWFHPLNCLCPQTLTDELNSSAFQRLELLFSSSAVRAAHGAPTHPRPPLIHSDASFHLISSDPCLFLIEAAASTIMVRIIPGWCEEGLTGLRR